LKNKDLKKKKQDDKPLRKQDTKKKKRGEVDDPGKIDISEMHKAIDQLV